MRKLLCLSLFLFTMLTVTGCSFFDRFLPFPAPELKPTTGTELDKLAEEKLLTLDSYKGVQTVTANLTSNGTDFNVLSTSNIKVTNQSSDDFATETYTRNLISYFKNPLSKNEYTESFSTSEGYCNGYMYLHSIYENYRSKIRSEISKTDYLTFKADRNALSISKRGDSTPGNSEIEQLENGDWKATLKDFNADFSKKYVSSLLGENLLIGINVQAMTVTINTTEDFTYKSIDINFELLPCEDEKNALNSFSVKTEFSDINSTVFQTPTMEEYALVDDLRALYTVSDAISQAEAEKSGECLISLDYDTYNNYSGEKETIREDSILTFKKGESVSYNLSSSSPFGKLTQSYSSGILTMVTEKNSELPNTVTLESTDNAQVAVINSFLNCFSFNIMRVTDFKILGEDVYEIKFHAAEAQKNNFNINIPVKLEITLKEGKLAKYYCTAYTNIISEIIPIYEVTTTYKWN